MSAVSPKLLLIDEAWDPAPGRVYREFFFADTRVDDLISGALRDAPLKQFIDGIYYDRYSTGFVPERNLQGERWKHRWT